MLARGDLRIGAAVAVILVLCLSPSAETTGRLELCLFCGSQATANFVLNVLLYVPLGLALSTRVGSLGKTALAGAALSLGVEVSQYYLPGRFPSLMDLIANSSGTVVGFLLAGSLATLLRPSPQQAKRYVVMWSLVTAVGLMLMALASRPFVPDAELTVGWTPELGGMDQYRGRVLSASVGGHSLPSWWSLNDQSRGAFQLGAPLEVVFEAAPTGDRISPLLHIADSPNGETLILGLRGQDVVVRRHRLASRIGLARPEEVFFGALRNTSGGDTVQVTMELDRSGTAQLTVNGGDSVTSSLNAGRFWSYWYAAAGVSKSAARAIDLLAIALLLIPIAFWAPRPPWLLWALPVIVVMAASPIVAAPSLPPAWYLVFGACVLLLIHALALEKSRLRT